MAAYLKATYQEQIEFRDQYCRLQNVILCKFLRIIGKCVLKHPEKEKA